MNRGFILLCLLAFSVVVLVSAPLWGIEHVPLRALWADHGVQAEILWKLRIPRVVLALLAGSGLAVSGMVFQAMFRNPLATPFTLGVSSGASLGAAVYIFLGQVSSPLWVATWRARLEQGLSPTGISGTSLFAFAGALAAILLVYGLARTRRGFSTTTMLLAGVAIAFFFSSLILLMQYLSDFTRTFRMLRWVMGGLDSVVDFQDVLSVLPFVAAGCLIVLYLTHELNLITTGEELAASRGVEVDRTKLVLFFATSLMVGAVVAVCGPIGFVGLMAPHICRLLVGPDHRYLLPATLLFGGAFLILCDTLARTVMAPTELPVGILTSLLGGPFFLWLLLSRSRESGMG
jgi:iron complex transport system permease protein